MEHFFHFRNSDLTLQGKKKLPAEQNSPSRSFSINYLSQHTPSNTHPNRGPKFVFFLWAFYFASDLTNGERVNVQRQKPARRQKQIFPPDGGQSRRKVQNHDACAKEALLSCMSGSTVPSLMGNKLFFFSTYQHLLENAKNTSVDSERRSAAGHVLMVWPG